MNSNAIVLIPAYQPDERLLEMVSGLLNARYREVVVVDDGSAATCRPIFENLALMPHCHVVKHAINLGKGRALKSGYNFILSHFGDIQTVITADCDGQHALSDINALSAILNGKQNTVALGVRKFEKDVPLKSSFGNFAIRAIFFLSTGQWISDTQTGLRGFTIDTLPLMMAPKGERYEYEMNVLLMLKQKGIELIEHPIQTIYIDNNAGSHFNPLIDSLRILAVIFTFIGASTVAAVFDVGIFLWLAYGFAFNPEYSFIAARIVSASLNFVLNRKLVFKAKGDPRGAIFRYACLVVFILVCSSLLIKLLTSLGWSPLAAKLVSDGALFLINFYIQRTFVFRPKRRPTISA